MSRLNVSVRADVVAHLYGLAHAHRMKHPNDEVGTLALLTMSDAWQELEEKGVNMAEILKQQRLDRSEWPF